MAQKNAGELWKLLKIALPLMVATLGNLAYLLVDNITVGHFLGAEFLASSSLASNFFYLVLPFAIGSLSIVPAKLSYKIAQKNMEGFRRTFKDSLLLSIVLGAIISCVTIAFTQILPFFSSSQQLAGRSVKYLAILSLAPLFILPFFAFEKTAEAMGDTRICMLVILLCNIVNCVLNYGLILGKFGLPELGLYGAATATVITSALELCLIVGFFFRFKVLKAALEDFRNYEFSGSRFKRLLKKALPSGFHVLSESGTFAVCGILCGMVGAVHLAGYQITIGITSIPFIIIYSLGAALTVRIAHHKGKKNIKMVRKIANYSLIFTTFFMVVIGAFFWLFRREIAALFVSGGELDIAVIELTAAALAFIVFFEVFDALQNLTSAMLRGMADFKIPGMIAVFLFTGVAIPSAFYLGVIKNMGVIGVWLALGVCMVMAAAAFIIRLKLCLKNYQKELDNLKEGKKGVL